MICVNSIKVYPNSITLKVGTWYYNTYAEVCPANADCKSVTWHSDNTNVATVNSTNGYIYAKATGTAKIYATATDGSCCNDYICVTVSNTVSVESVTLNKSSISLEKDTCYALSATILPANATNKILNWTSSNTNVARVTDGVVMGVSEGSAIITATAADGSGKSDSCTVTVTETILVSSITLNPPSKTALRGDSFSLSATVLPQDADDKRISWHSDNTSVATVNSLGIVTAIGVGNTMIYATAMDGSGTVGSCNVMVSEPIKVMEITINSPTCNMYREKSYAFSATIKPINASVKTIRWCSDNPKVATVNESTGVVRAISAGSATIYANATDGSGVSACCRISVKQTVYCAAEEIPTSKTKESVSSSPVNAFTGSYSIAKTLMPLFGGLGISLVARYDSTKLGEGDMGSGWYHNFEKSVEVSGDEAYVYSDPSTYSKYVSANPTHTTFNCVSPDKNGYVLTVNPYAQYPYVIDCNSSRTEYYNTCGNLAKIKDHQGFEILITYNGNIITITDTVSGKKIYLHKNANCRVVKVSDDHSREAVLTYNGNLITSICDVNGNTFYYTYTDGIMTSSTDKNNRRYFENTYDEYGRIKTQQDATSTSANSSTFGYESDTRTITDRNGNQSTCEYGDTGLLLSYTDANNNGVTYEYDDHCNVTKETDANGKSTIKVYNSFNKPTEITDKNGNKTYITYDTEGNVTKIRYPAICGATPEETFEYNARNQITKHTDVRGTVTVYTYDANGMPATKKIGCKNAIEYTYVNGLLKSQKDALGNVTEFTHNDIGQVISAKDAKNNVTQYEYDKLGNLLKTTDANGKTVVNTYDHNYQKTAVTDANGNKTEYSYNENLVNDCITLPDGNEIRYEFDKEDRPIKIIDQANNATVITYDKGGRVVSKRFADGATVQYEYDAVGNVTKETNPKGAIVTKTYDNMGNVLTVTDDAGNTTTYEYNALSKVSKATNAATGSVVYVYSAAGELLSETDSLGHTKSYTYDDFGNRLTETDAKGNVTTYTYDQNNNLLTVKDALNNVTTYTYNALNQCISVKDALNNVIHYGYDALGRRTTITDARGNVFTTFYDANGNVTKTTDAKGKTISETVYNCLNLPLTVTDAMDKSTTYTYNALGKVASVTDPLSNVTEFGYNSRGQNTTVVDAKNNTSTAAYDVLGNVTRLAGPLGGATSYTYDDMGRLIYESTVSGGTVSFTYTPLNTVNTRTNARGQQRQFIYDPMGKVTTFSRPEGAVVYTYDANGNVLTATDASGTVTKTYDALNRVSSITDTYGKTIGYEYDAVGNLIKITYPDNTQVTYLYDGNRNLIGVIDWAGRATAYNYDENNRVIGVTKPDGSITTTAYDDKQRVTSTVERTAGGAVITGFEYTYDDLSRIVEETHLDKNTKFCYTYDELSRVTERTIKNLTDDSVISTETFTYDAAGNLTDDSNDTTFAYDTNNRLTSYNGNSVLYDMDGNMLSNGSLLCTYDSSNKLHTANGHTYTYNAEDVRIRNLCEDEDTTYTYNTNAKLSMLLMKTTNGVVTKYVYGRGLIGEETSGAFKTYHFDCRGSTIAITDASGNITDTFAYDTYGKCISRTGTTPVIFGYNGRDGVVTDSNGLIYMRARYYSPEMRRFVNADIVAGELSNAITLNRFAYANGNPVSFVDPFGLSAGKNLFKKAFKSVKNAAVDVFDAVVDVGEAVVDGGKTAVNWVDNNIVDPVVDAGKSAVKWVDNNVVDPVVDAGKSAVKWVDNNIVDPVVEPIKEFVDEKIVQPTLDYVIENAPEPIAYFAEDIKNYNKNNNSEQTVLRSHYFSSYKGKLVIRTNMDRSGSFGILFITHETNNRTNPEDIIRHEYGHTKQLDQLGIVNYALFIGLPSWQEWSSDPYYDRPWEVTADTYGGVQSRTPAQSKINAGEDYLDIIKSDIPIWKKILQLSQYYS